MTYLLAAAAPPATTSTPIAINTIVNLRMSPPTSVYGRSQPVNGWFAAELPRRRRYSLRARAGATRLVGRLASGHSDAGLSLRDGNWGERRCFFSSCLAGLAHRLYCELRAWARPRKSEPSG